MNSASILMEQRYRSDLLERQHLLRESLILLGQLELALLQMREQLSQGLCAQ
jgi:hypothetical protein